MNGWRGGGRELVLILRGVGFKIEGGGKEVGFRNEGGRELDLILRGRGLDIRLRGRGGKGVRF